MIDLKNSKISTAVILSAGNGTRLLPLTKEIPKCLIEINGSSILVQLINTLEKLKFKKIIIVVGYLKDKIVNLIKESKNQWKKITIEFVVNDLYSTTNNIYSLWLVRNLIKEKFLLLESDLMFDSFLLKKFLAPDQIALAKFIPSMTGTTVEMNELGFVSKMYVGTTLNPDYEIKKTVNICSLSLSSWNIIRTQLNQRIKDGEVNEFYEIIFSKLIDEGNLQLKGIDFDTGKWCEIDTLKDLEIAESLFQLKKPEITA